MKLIVKKGTTSYRVGIFIADSSKTDGSGLTGLTSGSSGLVCYRFRSDDGNAAGTQISLTGATRGTFTSGGFVEKDATNMPGVYEIGIPDNALATGSDWVIIMLKGATNMAPVLLEIELVAADLEDGVRAGLTALPNAAAASAGGLPTVGTGASQIDVDASGRVNIGKWLGTLVTAASAGIPDVNTKNKNNAAALSDPANLNLLSIDANGRVDLSKVLGAAINALISGRIDANAQVVGDKTGYTVSTVSDKTGYSLTQSFPANFASLGIDINGRVDISKILGAAINALISGRIDANAQVVGDKTGYALTQSFPSNFSSLAIDVDGRVDLSKVLGSAINALISGRVDANAQVVGDKTGYTAATVSDKTGYSLSQSFPSNFASMSIDAGGNVKVQSPIKKNVTLNNFEFLMIDSADHLSGKTGLTFSTGDCKVSIDGAAFTNLTNLPSEVANGIYKINLDAADLNGGVVTLLFTQTGADVRLITIATTP